MSEKEIKVAIVDDHTLFRDGLINLLAEYEHITPLFKAANGIEMQKLFNPTTLPDIILMDINMSGMNGHEATKWIKKNYPQIHVLALSMYEDDKNIIEMLKMGAGGYILKECNAAELVRAITTIIENGYYFNELVSGRLMRSIKDNESEKEEYPVLTKRETDFLTLCCSELTYKEIAEEMNVSPRTVDGYRDILFEKLDIKSRTGLVLYAIKNGIFKL
jgi:DNA-binding NarL/FixJ family response regulator